MNLGIDGHGTAWLVADLTVPDEADRFVLEATERNGRVDILDAFGPGSGVGSALATPARAYQTAVDRSL